MANLRQAPVSDPVGGRDSAIVTLTRDYPAGYVTALHFHDRHQLVFATHGVMTVNIGRRTWVVPTFRAVWIPAGVAHIISMSGAVAMRTLYFSRRHRRVLPRDCCVINVEPLLRELIVHSCRLGRLHKRIDAHRHLIDLLVDRLAAVDVVPLQLLRPADPRAQKVATHLVQDPSDRRSLHLICKRAGASRRTLERLFQREAGLTLGKWRQQARLMHAMRLLAEGRHVTRAALDSGYSTPSAFIHMFRKSLGVTPMEYFRTPPTAALR